MNSPSWYWSGLFLALCLSGCGRGPERPPGTGAREAVQDFFEAILHDDPARAYAALDAESQQRTSPEDFRHRTQDYLRNVGFTPEHLLIRSCDERGADAVARIVYTGSDGAHARRHNDGISLRRIDDRWRVVLPGNFGSPAR